MSCPNCGRTFSTEDGKKLSTTFQPVFCWNCGKGYLIGVEGNCIEVRDKDCINYGVRDGFVIKFDLKDFQFFPEEKSMSSSCGYCEVTDGARNCARMECENRHNCLSRYCGLKMNFKFADLDTDVDVEGSEEVQKGDLTQKKKKETNSKNDTKNNTIKEGKGMANKKVSIKEQLWEHSPKENVELIKGWYSKYEDTFRWAVPVVCIYGAYKILNSKELGLTIDNIKKESKKKLGFTLDCLKDNQALNELLVLGGIAAGSVAVMNLASSVFGSKEGKDIAELSTEEIEAGLENVEKAHKKFNFITPKTEKLLPVATAVIIVYLMTEKPEWFEKVKAKVSSLTSEMTTRAAVYLDLVKLFISDKLHVDLENEEEVKKFKLFALLLVAVGIGVVIYGKGILGQRADTNESEKNSKKNEKFSAFVQEISEVMKKLMPAAFEGLTAFLVARHVLMPKDEDSAILDTSCEEVDEADEKEDKAETDEIGGM